jgi:S1-C subfamily serine protease
VSFCIIGILTFHPTAGHTVYLACPQVNGRPMRSVNELIEVTAAMFPGMRAMFLVERGGAKFAVTVLL